LYNGGWGDVTYDIEETSDKQELIKTYKQQTVKVYKNIYQENICENCKLLN